MDKFSIDTRFELVEYRNRSCKKNCLFDVSEYKELGEAFFRKNIQPLVKREHQHKRNGFDILVF